MLATYSAQTSSVRYVDGELKVDVSQRAEYVIRTELKRPKKLGLMFVGWGGNNGSTLTAALLANKLKLSWESRRGTEHANFLGSLVMATTVSLGTDKNGQDVSVKMHDIASFVDPCDIVVGGWDISSMSIGDALVRSRVLEPDLIRQVKPTLGCMRPLPSIYDPSFIASNQVDRVDNALIGTKWEKVEQIRKDITMFKAKNKLDKIIVMWTANTERMCQVKSGVHDTVDNFVRSVYMNEPEISPSSLFAYAAINEGCPFINGSPQNTLVPALVDLAVQLGVPIGGDDFKSGQTKIKSVLADFLISSGIKPVSIVSYNHLGNNDGRNLAEAAQFKSKQISKSGVVEDMVRSNPVLYPVRKDRGPDHTVVIEYVPAVGDSKRALDEYESEIFMGGRNTISMHNTCEDSLLAAPLMLDLVLLLELFSRISVSSAKDGGFEPLHPVMSLLAFCLKAPMFPKGVPVVNALMRQRRSIEDLLKICVGLPPTDDLSLHTRLL